MGAVEETQKRSCIIDDLVKRVGNNQGIIISGSMAFGQNRIVHERSDIDIGLLCRPRDVRSLVDALGFTSRPSASALDAFADEEIDSLRIPNTIEGVPTTAFLYNTFSLVSYLAANRSFVVWSPKPRPPEFLSYGFDGSSRMVARGCKEELDGYTYEFPELANGKYYTYATRAEFLGAGKIVADPLEELASMEDAAWYGAIGRLLEEHGPEVDLTKHNVLNTLQAHHAGKFSQELIEQIQKRTIKEIEKYRAAK